MLDYAALTAVAAVVREGSFDRAATALGVTPSAVSQRVRALEERLGTVLVIRGQPCRATPAGQRLCAHVDQVRLLERDLAGILPRVGQDRPTLRVAVNADSLATWFPAGAAAFAARSDALLDIVLDDEDHTAERLRSGDVLAAVTTDPAPVPGCRLTHLGALRYVACASPAFMTRHFSDRPSAGNLNGAPVLGFDRRDRLQTRWAKDTFDVELHAPTHWVPSTQGFVDFALQGLGWGMQPLVLLQPHLAAGRLVELVPMRPLDVALQWQATRLDAGALGELTRAVRAAAGGCLERFA